MLQTGIVGDMPSYAFMALWHLWACSTLCGESRTRKGDTPRLVVQLASARPSRAGLKDALAADALAFRHS